MKRYAAPGLLSVLLGCLFFLIPGLRGFGSHELAALYDMWPMALLFAALYYPWMARLCTGRLDMIVLAYTVVHVPLYLSLLFGSVGGWGLMFPMAIEVVAGGSLWVIAFVREKSKQQQ